MPSTFQSTARDDRMIPVEEAQQRVLAEVGLLGTEQVPLVEALGRVLREDVRSMRDIPEADNTAMDGYAVRSSDVADASVAKPVTLRVIEDLPAGTVSMKHVDPGTAIRIMTGALIPPGADAVVPVELTDAGSQSVQVNVPVAARANLRSRGEDMTRDSVVLTAGTRLGPAEVGVLASVQKPLVLVGRRPTVAIISTGDEVVEIDEPLAPGKVVNSNSYSLAALAREAGALPLTMGITADTKEATIQTIEAALQSDFVISSGGVSVGAYDFVKDALDALGASTRFWQVSMKPGKPVVLSTLRERLFFGLPGNPVSCMVSFLLFVGPSLRKSMGQKHDLIPPTVIGKLDGVLRSRGDRRAYQRVRVVARDGELIALPMSAQGSGVSTSMIRANGFAVMETGVTSMASGALVPLVLFGPIQTD
ncbi:MAG: gephyrin-like molybdotransferase Glp [Acidobacteriota bacterium]